MTSLRFALLSFHTHPWKSQTVPFACNASTFQRTNKWGKAANSVGDGTERRGEAARTARPPRALGGRSWLAQCFHPIGVKSQSPELAQRHSGIANPIHIPRNPEGVLSKEVKRKNATGPAVSNCSGCRIWPLFSPPRMSAYNGAGEAATPNARIKDPISPCNRRTVERM